MDASGEKLSSLRIDRSAPSKKSKRGRRGRRWLPWALLALGVGVVVFLFIPKATAVQVQQVRVTGGDTASAGAITANGYVVARTKAEVSPKQQGLLVELDVTEGSVVKRGDILGRLDNRDLQAERRASLAQVKELEARVEHTKRELARQEKLLAYKVTPRSTYETALTEHRMAEAQLVNAQARVKVTDADIESTLIRAPFSGTVLEKNAEVGELVGAFNSLGDLKGVVTMADLASLEVEVDVNEAYIGKVQNDQPARVTLDAYPDVSFAGKVRQVIPTADRQKATVQVKVAINERDPRILPEMGAKVTFLAKGEEALAKAPRQVSVPEAALVGSDVFVVENDVAKKVPVQLGQRSGGNVVVNEGLTGSEVVVVEPPERLQDGAKVRVENGEARGT